MPIGQAMHQSQVPIGISASLVHPGIKDPDDRKLMKAVVSLMIHPEPLMRPDIAAVLQEVTHIAGRLPKVLLMKYASLPLL